MGRRRNFVSDIRCLDLEYLCISVYIVYCILDLGYVLLLEFGNSAMLPVVVRHKVGRCCEVCGRSSSDSK